MWESALYSKLINDPELIQYVSLYNNIPSIFSNSAPENVAFPYIVFVISNTGGPDSAVDTFDVVINHFDFKESAKRSGMAVKRIIELLDREHITHADFTPIRLYKTWAASAGRENEDRDPRAQHYIVRFSGRAGRKGWIENLTTP